MKKLLILSAFVLATVALPLNVTVKAEVVDPGKVSMVYMGSVAALNGLSDWDGGFALGAQFPFPGLEAKDIHVRFVYSQYNISPDAPMRTIEPCAIIDFYVGKKWRIWWKAIGLEAYTDGLNSGMALYTGAGIGRRIWTIEGTENKLGIDLFLESSFVNADGKETGDYADVSLVLLLSRL